MEDKEEELRARAIKEQKEKRLKKIQDEKNLAQLEKTNAKLKAKMQKKEQKEKKQAIAQENKKQKQREKEKKELEKLKQKQEKLDIKQQKKVLKDIAKTQKILDKQQQKEQKKQLKIQEIEKKEKQKQKEEQKKQLKQRIENRDNVDFSYENDEQTRMEMTKTYNKKRQAQIKNKNIKKQKKKRKHFRIFITLFIIFVLSFSIYFILTSQMFKISSIEVTNNSIVDEKTVIELSNLLDKNIFLINDILVEDDIRENFAVESININRKLPNKVEIQIKERTPMFYLCDGEDVYVISDQGYIMAKNNTKIDLSTLKNVSGLNINGLGQRLSNSDLNKLEHIYKIDEILESLSQSLNMKIEINSYTFENSNLKIRIDQEQKDVYLGDDENISKKLIKLFSILEQTKGKSGTIYLEENSSNYKAFFREETTNEIINIEE